LFKIWGDKRKKMDKKDGTMKWVSKIAEAKGKKYRPPPSASLARPINISGLSQEGD
jgi:hypothetical protein